MAQNSGRKQTPSFFDDDDALDPVKAATSTPKKVQSRSAVEENQPKSNLEPTPHSTIEPKAAEKKKKAGYYFKPSNIERFENAFLEIQLKRYWKGRQSEFMEAILEFGLADLETGDQSQILEALKKK